MNLDTHETSTTKYMAGILLRQLQLQKLGENYLILVNKQRKGTNITKLFQILNLCLL